MLGSRFDWGLSLACPKGWNVASLRERRPAGVTGVGRTREEAFPVYKASPPRSGSLQSTTKRRSNARPQGVLLLRQAVSLAVSYAARGERQ
eukprot:scaffold4435_cov221-Prasinococcus_capsulatus_cf.AAC.1